MGNYPIDGHQPSSDERTMVLLAHASAILNLAMGGLGGPIAAGLIWAIYKDRSPWVGFHALQALIFQGIQLGALAIIVGGSWVLGFVFSFATVGFGTLIAVPFMFLTFCLGGVILITGTLYGLYAAYQVNLGRDFRYPWIADWLEKHR